MRSIRNCNVCVTGGAGFLGSHLVNHLIEDRGCNVLVVDNLVSGRREFIHHKATFVHADITQSESYLRKLFEMHSIQYVFQYSAYPYIPDSFARPLHVFNVNSVGALQVINAAQEAGCHGILQVSSAEIYGEGYGKISETSPVTPHSSYGASKAAIDAMVQVRWQEAKTPVIALRQFNCIGERETHPYVVPEIISQVNGHVTSTHSKSWNRVPTVCLGNDSFRDFLYAGDQVRMAVELLEVGDFGEVYNLGSEHGIRIYALAKFIGQLMGFDTVEVIEDPARVRPWEIWHLQSDNTKIHRAISTRPSTGLHTSLERTINYFRESGCRWCWE